MAKAKFVYEELNFERGQEPKQSMNIGGAPSGTLYFIKKKFYLGSPTHEIFPNENEIFQITNSYHSDFEYEKYEIIRLTERISYLKNDLLISFFTFSSLNAARKDLKEYRNSQIPTKALLTEDQFKEYLERVDESTREYIN